MSEFNLSEKITLCSYGEITRYGFVSVEDVKEAIRLIKLNPTKIDEIVGEKLI